MRYQWRKPSDLPERVELFDSATNQPVAQIVSVGRSWQWRRKTTRLLHGAPPSEGTACSLAQAKINILDGLPNE